MKLDEVNNEELEDGPISGRDVTQSLAECPRCGLIDHDGRRCPAIRSANEGMPPAHTIWNSDLSAPPRRGPLAGIDLLYYCRTGQVRRLDGRMLTRAQEGLV